MKNIKKLYQRKAKEMKKECIESYYREGIKMFYAPLSIFKIGGDEGI